MISKRLSILALFLTALFLAACVEDEPAVSFPDTHIVYQAAIDQAGERAAIGFINPDGSNLTLLETSFSITQPSWSSDGTTLYFRQIPLNQAQGIRDAVYKNPGRISIWPENQKRIFCGREFITDWAVYSFPDSNDILTGDALRIQRINWDSCEIVETYVNYVGSPKRTSGVGEFSLSKDGRFLVYSELYISIVSGGYKFTIFIKDLDTGEVTEVGQGINPAISPDNTRIAYTWYDGIHIVNVDGTNDRHEISQKLKAGNMSSEFQNAPPAPQWSPDGKFLVYHKCVLRAEYHCYKVYDFAIYTLNVEKHKESKIVEDGVYPYWR